MMATTFRDQLTAAIPVLTSFARSLTQSRAEADDLLQDTLERALTRQALYAETGGPLISWLYMMMRNLFIDRVRARRRHEHFADGRLGPLHGRGAVPASQEDRRFLAELQALLARLPRNGGGLILAIGVQGHGYDETAARFKVRPGTVRSRLSRSRAALLRAALTSAPLPGQPSRDRSPREAPTAPARAPVAENSAPE